MVILLAVLLDPDNFIQDSQQLEQLTANFLYGKHPQVEQDLIDHRIIKS